MTNAELRKIVAAQMKSAGWLKYSKGWWLPEGDLAWAVSLDKDRYHPRFELLVGCWPNLGPGEPAESAGVAQISVQAYRLLPKPGSVSADEGIDTAANVNVMEAFDLRIGQDDEVRENSISAVLTQVDRFTRAHLTFESVFQSHEAGALNGPSVRKETYELFQQRRAT